MQITRDNNGPQASVETAVMQCINLWRDDVLACSFWCMLVFFSLRFEKAIPDHGSYYLLQNTA